LELHKTGKLIDFSAMTKDICQVALQPRATEKINRNSNLAIGCHVNAKARIFMHKTVRNLQLQKSVRIFMIVNDSLFFSTPNSTDVSNLICMGHSPGQFFSVYDSEIEAFTALGSKSYSVLLNSPNKKMNIVKLAGFSSQHLLNPQNIDHTFIDALLSDMIEKTVGKFSCFEVRTKHHKLMKNVSLQKKRNMFSFFLWKKRQRYVNTSSKYYETVAFGYQRCANK
jgi:hypothetical protein